MTIHVRYKNFDQLSFADLLVYSKLPAHPFWSHVESKIDFSFADKLCAVLYTGKGQRPFAPSLKLKVHLVQSYCNTSDRLVEEKIIGDLFIKRFLQLPVDFFGFDHSTIGLDRSRMGEAMFRACHLYILAQMLQHGLWGDKDEQWIIDSFPTNVQLVCPGTYRLIQHALIRLVQHLRKHAPKPVLAAVKSLPLDAMGVRISASTSTSDRLLAYSKLVAQAYGLLAWFNNENVKPLLAEWRTYARSQELQAILKQILEENSRPVAPNDGAEADLPGDASNDETKSDLPEDIHFEKTPRDERPKDRAVSAVDPQARVASKRSDVIIGYKTQNLCTTGGVILDTRTIPANEHDQDATADMTLTIQRFFAQTPVALLADSAYGHGKHRLLLAKQGIQIVAPLQTYENPTGLFRSTSFTYNAEKDVYVCPNGKQSVRKNRNNKLEGHQYIFAKQTCFECPLRAQCTNSEKSGRRVFRSDYVDIYENARVYNESEKGQEDLRKRYIVERKNNELKNHCGLGHAKTRSQTSLQLKSLCAAMVVNLKHTVRKLINPKPGFIRHARTVMG